MTGSELVKKRLLAIAKKHMIVAESSDGVARAMILADDMEKFLTDAMDGIREFLASNIDKPLDPKNIDKSSGPVAIDTDKLGPRPFHGKIIVLDTYSPSSDARKVTERGGTVHPRVTKKTDLVIVNRLTGIKYRTALKYGIPVLGSIQFSDVVKTTKPIIF